MDIPQAGTSWVDAFRRRHGRAPRVLHIGNIANNAYKIAKALNLGGLDCDVICHSYYHIMACPEWEEADGDFRFRDQFHPDWHEARLGDYERPRWFVQGELETCIAYLLARRRRDTALGEKLWKVLQHENRTRRFGPGGLLALLPQVLAPRTVRLRRRVKALFHDRKAAQRAARRIEAAIGTETRLRRALARLAAGVAAAAITAFQALLPFRAARAAYDAADSELQDQKARWARRFQESFPLRRDQLGEDEVTDFLRTSKLWAGLLQEYDIVQAYATDPIIPMLNGSHPYVAFEHGTLRVFSLEDNTTSRLTALAYNRADHVFITNGDCRDYAERIGVTRYSGIPHPVETPQALGVRGDPGSLRRRYGVSSLFLCPLRHDWAIKGTDRYIRALPLIKARLGPDFKLLATNWGADLASSRSLAEELGVMDRIDWIDPLPRHALLRMVGSVDIVFDQIALPVFGATAPEAIGAGTPVIMSYDSALTEWFIPEPAPILCAWTPDEIAAQVAVALDGSWRKEYEARARLWFERWHSIQAVAAEHLKVYSRLCPAG
ncbi:MAG: hypothetical protein A3I02_01460 [Betaproteobacteria bacterium RIFCSPLOWO2_02_FULL_67_26]|nr:MAG: hypothetical protein A3I02_01460 [Betaproteobacteria bacterium RIFCSPLOWO2_02_FULL_67_26]